MLARMKTLSIVSLVVAAAFATSFAGAHQVTVNGKTPKGVKIIKLKDSKGVQTVSPKKKRHKFLGIF